MCYHIYTEDTNKMIVRGTVRSAENTISPNLTLSFNEELDEQKGEVEDLLEDPPLQNSAHNFPIDYSGELNYLNTEELLNMAFGNPTNVPIKMEPIEEEKEQEEDNIPTRIYNEVLDNANKNNLEEYDRWYFDSILSHRTNNSNKVELKIK